MGPEEHRFSCTLCGDCCTGSQVVRLCGGDLDLLVRRLGLGSWADLRSQGLVSLVRESAGPGRTWWRPRLRFRTRPLRQCPFLANDLTDDGQYRGLCTLHPDHKPLVCALSPLAREVDDPGTGPASEQWSFVPPVDGCPGVGRGPELTLGPPPDLRARLDAEVAWARSWIALSGDLDTEDAAWAALGAPETGR